MPKLIGTKKRQVKYNNHNNYNKLSRRINNINKTPAKNQG